MKMTVVLEFRRRGCPLLVVVLGKSRKTPLECRYQGAGKLVHHFQFEMMDAGCRRGAFLHSRRHLRECFGKQETLQDPVTSRGIESDAMALFLL